MTITHQYEPRRRYNKWVIYSLILECWRAKGIVVPPLPQLSSRDAMPATSSRINLISSSTIYKS